ncbi:hypothetical protein Lbys_2398 [Leadbetterella byssophila DSM 17132]|uniref:Uncharacterized protein n=1 Tax=Leadbetterella byssophila (strain DSM 17132 / JCM 16389 / KACC 11308 / NBRC 106382 / 4M15) TaxID=649349 RepID=E4RX33_LEAB4|nr:hypothetical protein [Leadbetterella byssophila]ADQ18072.1 hypothetical protein Lbys_2398 [Leadbetterella byssophila DSM 17132]
MGELTTALLMLCTFTTYANKFWGSEETYLFTAQGASNIENNSYGSNGKCVAYYRVVKYVFWIEVDSYNIEKEVDCYVITS